MADMKLQVIISAVDQVRGVIKNITADARGLAQGLNTAGMAMGVAGAAISGGVMAAAHSAQVYGEQVDKAVKTTGVGAEAFQKLAYAAEQEHASMQAVSTGFRFLSRNMYAAAQGGAEAQAAFAAVGVSTTDAVGKARPMNDVMLDVADKFKAMPPGAEKAALAMKLFGRSGQELVPFLSQGSTEIRRLGDEAGRMGMVLSGKSVKDAEAFGDMMNRWSTATKAISRQIGSVLIPVLMPLIEHIGTLMGRMAKWIELHPGLASGVALVTVELGSLLLIGGPLLIFLGNMVTAWKSVTDAIIAAKIARAAAGAMEVPAAGAAVVGATATVVGSAAKVAETGVTMSLAVAEAELAAAQTAVAVASAREAASLGMDASAKAAAATATEGLAIAEANLAAAQAAQTAATATGTGIIYKLGFAFGATQRGIASFGTMLTGLIGPGGLIALVVVAVAGLALELWNLWKRFREMKSAMAEAKAAKQATHEAFAAAGAKGEGIGQAIDLSGRKARKHATTAAAQVQPSVIGASMAGGAMPSIPGPAVQAATVASDFFAEPESAMAGALDTTQAWVADTNDAVKEVFSGLPAVATGMFGGFQNAVAVGMQNMVDRIRGYTSPVQDAMQSVTRIPSVVTARGMGANSTEAQQSRATSNDDWRTFGAQAAESFKAVFGVTLDSLENGINTAANMINLTPVMAPAMAGAPGALINPQPAAAISGDRYKTTIEIDTFGAGLDIANRLPYGRVKY